MLLQTAAEGLLERAARCSHLHSAAIRELELTPGDPHALPLPYLLASGHSTKHHHCNQAPSRPLLTHQRGPEANVILFFPFHNEQNRFQQINSEIKYVKVQLLRIQ